MQKHKTKLFSLLVLPLLAMPQPVQPEPQIIEPTVWVAPTPIQVIKKYSDEYKIDASLLYSVLICESSLNPQISAGDSGHSKGIAQIKDPTWDYLEKKLNLDLDKGSYHDAIRLTAGALSINEGNNWTPYRAIKNGGSYTFFNRHTGKEQTVYCSYKTIPIQ
jgi:hypothetical protein